MRCGTCTNRKEASRPSHLHVATNESWGLNKPDSFPLFFKPTFCGSGLRHLGAKFCIVPPPSDTRNLSNAADAHVRGCEGLIPAQRHLPLLLICQSLREREHQVHAGMHRLFDSPACRSAEFERKTRGRRRKNQKSWARLRWNSDRGDKKKEAAERISSLVLSQAWDLIICFQIMRFPLFSRLLQP